MLKCIVIVRTKEYNKRATGNAKSNERSENLWQQKQLICTQE